MGNMQGKEEIKLFKKKRKAATCSTSSVNSETLTLQDQECKTSTHRENKGTRAGWVGRAFFLSTMGNAVDKLKFLKQLNCVVRNHQMFPYLSVTYSGNACGHPCMMCLQANNIESSILTADHSYTKRIGPSTWTKGVNTDITMETTDKNLTIWPLTPIPKIPPSSISTLIKENDIFNSSISSHSFSDDKNDLTFDIDRDIQSSDENEGNESTDSDDTEACITYQRKCIVFEKQLDQLFAMLKCDECDCPVDLSDTKKDCSSGTIMRVSVFCTRGHLIYKWLSQPLTCNMPAVNLLVTAATMLCGQTFTHIAQFAELMRNG
ncbi:Hypothetical predicted protein [Mytilus galloprovincialis]|uniref:Uncharacterized protein n=1 Tax=Mytilus galloprovincialis TaxID=29158 RepID=A0A8B6GA61_MYTGA|nr:Hypothetical predicted protein [Mytilus galloprovincialis]